MTEQYDLRPLWDEMVKMAQIVLNICQRHHIRCYLAGGSLIGAVRHKGFIPWDDDLDLMIPRSDYDRFIQIAAQELSAPYGLKSYETTPNEVWCPYAKVVVTDSEIVEIISVKSGLKLEQGVFVDLFPMDGLPHSSLGMFVFRGVRSVLRRWGGASRCALLQWWSKRWRYDKSEYMGWAHDERADYHKWRWQRKWYDKTVMLPFDSIMAPAPGEYDKVLTAVYGDYMKLPPIEQRHPTHQKR